MSTDAGTIHSQAANKEGTALSVSPCRFCIQFKALIVGSASENFNKKICFLKFFHGNIIETINN